MNISKFCLFTQPHFNFLWFSSHLLPVILPNLISFLRTLEKAMAPHSSTLAWKIPWTEEPGRLHSMGSLGVRHNWATSLSLFTFMHWRRKWQPTPVFLPGKSQGRGCLVGCHLWDRTESDTTEATEQQNLIPSRWPCFLLHWENQSQVPAISPSHLAYECNLPSYISISVEKVILSVQG